MFTKILQKTTASPVCSKKIQFLPCFRGVFVLFTGFAKSNGVEFDVGNDPPAYLSAKLNPLCGSESDWYNMSCDFVTQLFAAWSPTI